MTQEKKKDKLRETIYFKLKWLAHDTESNIPLSDILSGLYDIIKIINGRERR